MVTGLDRLLRDEKRLAHLRSPQHGMRGDKQYNMEESPSALFKAVRTVQPDFELWRDFPTNTSPAIAFPSTSSTAGRRYVNGWTMLRRRQAIGMARFAAMKMRGAKNATRT